MDNKTGGAKKNPIKKIRKQSRSVEEDDTEKKPPVKKVIVEPKYYPIGMKLHSLGAGILETKENVIFSKNIDYPCDSIGFTHFIHASKNKVKDMFKKFDGGKKKVYLVMNDFEKYIDDYENSIGNASNKYFALKDKPEILSRAFYKLWELLFMFDLIDIKKDSFVSAHLAEGPGSFIQATMFYRDMFCKKGVSKNDKYYAVTLHPEDTTTHVPDIETKFVDYYEKEKPKRFILHKTYSKEMSGGNKTKDNGDIINPKTLKLFGGQMDEYADFITADGGFDWVNESVQEQEAFKLIFAQIVGAFKLQEKGGSFVCKFFETFALTSVKMLAILVGLYKEVYIVKPLMSRPSNSEKYVICVDFKFGHKEDKYKEIDKKLSNMLKEIHKNKDNIIDIFTDYDIPKHFLNMMTEINREVSNSQLWSLNNIFTFINSNNYYGDIYQSRREEQIMASEFWIELFYPDQNKLEEHKKKSKEILEYSFEISDESFKKLDAIIKPTFDY